jgi:hypothetical protein
MGGMIGGPAAVKFPPGRVKSPVAGRANHGHRHGDGNLAAGRLCPAGGHFLFRKWWGHLSSIVKMARRG